MNHGPITGMHGKAERTFQTFAPGEDKSLTRPDMSFTIKEIKERFTLQQIHYESQMANPLYMLDSTSEDFDAPSVLPTDDFDIITARSSAIDASRARREYLDSIRSRRTSSEKSTHVETSSSNSQTSD